MWVTTEHLIDFPMPYMKLHFFKKLACFVLGYLASSQCCDSFSWAGKGLCHMYTCIHAPPSLILSRFPQNNEWETWLFYDDNLLSQLSPLVVQMVKNLPEMWKTQLQSLGQEDSLEKRNGYSLQYSSLENSMDRGVCQATVHGVADSPTWLSD